VNTNTRPKTFGEWRTALEQHLRKAGVKELVCLAVGDLNYEGGELPEVLYRHWESFRSEHDDWYKDKKKATSYYHDWTEIAETPVHDCVIDLVCDFWPEGRARCKEIAVAVVKSLLNRHT
jgi:hypothetical protein